MLALNPVISIRFTELQNDRNAKELCFEQQLMEMQFNPHIVVTVSLDASGHAGGLTIWRKGIHMITKTITLTITITITITMTITMTMTITIVWACRRIDHLEERDPYDNNNNNCDK